MARELSVKERKALAAVHLDRRRSAADCAKATGLQPHTVMYSLKRLREHSIIRPFTMVNLHALGLTDYCVFFNLISDAKRVRSHVLEYCVRSSQTAYVAELSGKYQFSVSIFARSIVEVEAFFDGLMRKIPRSSVDMSFAMRSQWSVLPLKYLDPLAAKMSPLNRLASQPEVEVDETDKKILILLGHEPDMPLARAASRVGLAGSSIHYRLENLIDRGVIIGFPYSVDGARIGRHPFRILIITRGLHASLQRELFRFATQHPLCTMFVRCLGAWDFELNFDLADISQGGEVVQEVYDHFGPSIQTTMTVTELGIWKVHEFPPRDGFR